MMNAAECVCDSEDTNLSNFKVFTDIINENNIQFAHQIEEQKQQNSSIDQTENILLATKLNDITYIITHDELNLIQLNSRSFELLLNSILNDLFMKYNILPIERMETIYE